MKGPYRTPAPSSGIEELGVDHGWVTAQKFRCATLATPRARTLVKEMLSQKGVRVDYVHTTSDPEGLLHFRVYRSDKNGWKHWTYSLPEERLLSCARSTNRLFYEFVHIVDSIHRMILSTDREGFRVTYSDRDLEAPLV